MSITFENPPINEVVVSTYFTPQLSDFRSEHVGLFWEKIREEFPVARQQPPTASLMASGLDVNADELFPMPRYWFIADDDISLIQIQKDAFMFNWRRRDDAYPRFHRDIKPTFDRYYGLFSEFVREEVQIEAPSIDLCELTYINALERCEFWEGPQDTTKVHPFISNSLSRHKCFSDLRNSTAITITESKPICNLISVYEAELWRSKMDAPVLIFEIRASARLGQVTKSEADEWFERAHDCIIRCFAGMTDQDIQRSYWELQEEMR